MASGLTREERVQLAIKALEDGTISSQRKAGIQFNIPQSTLQARIQGRRSAREVQQCQQRLSVQEEDSIKRCIHTMTSWGWPVSIKYLKSLTIGLLQARGDYEPLGQHWYKNFLARHPDLKTAWSRSLDQSRKDATDYTILQDWFKLYRETCATFGISDEDQYNMDEKGFMKGIGDDVKVLVPITEEEVFSIQPGNREWVSVIECIGTNGYFLPAFVIFQGQRIQESWVNAQMDKRTILCVSDNGWTNRTIALDWLKHFDQYTRPQTQGKYRLLILDGHTSHVSLPFIQYCEQHNIIPLCLPPHSTHILQPLDIGIFSPLAKAYKKRIQQHSIFGTERITNEQFLAFFQLARQEAMSLKNIASAWRAAGLKPFNPSPILQKYRPKISPFASFTNDDGVRVDIQVQPNEAQKINEFVAQLLRVCPTPHRSKVTFIRDTALIALADKNTLQFMNEGLVQKTKEGRQSKTKKHFGMARVLTVEEALQKREERNIKEQQAAHEKERATALRGKIGFAKIVWKEGYQMSIDVFS
jgi:hypothetical protein